MFAEGEFRTHVVLVGIIVQSEANIFKFLSSFLHYSIGLKSYIKKKLYQVVAYLVHKFDWIFELENDIGLVCPLVHCVVFELYFSNFVVRNHVLFLHVL